MPLCLLLLALLLVGCPQPAANTDAATDRADANDLGAPDVTDEDTLDGAEIADVVDVPDVPDVRDVSVDRADGGDAGCTPGTTRPCTCVTGRAGTYTCHPSRVLGFCTCVALAEDGGVAAPLPPRLVFPLSDTRVTSRRPTLRWVLPDGITRARVELCADRGCTRMIVREEVSGSAWRSATPLATGVVFWRVHGLGPTGEIAWTSATWEFLVRHRDTEVDSAYGTIHDFNGDGFDDVVAGTDRSTDALLYVYHGTPRGLQDTEALVLTSPEGIPGGWSGFASDVSVGDVNGDGLADVAVSEPFYGYRLASPMDGGAPPGFGHVHVFTGAESGLSMLRHQTIDLAFETDRPTESYFGWRVAFVDFNGDGFDDLLASRASALRGYPQVFLFLGGASGLRASFASSLISARSPRDPDSIRGVGDVNGDGYGDFACGDPRGDDGEIGLFVLYGNPAGRLDARTEEIRTPESHYDFGIRVTGGDFNGDGFGDVLAASLGALSVLHGTASGLEMARYEIRPPHGIEVGRIFGDALGVQGDLNGDGFVDLAIAAVCDSMYERRGFWCSYGATYLFASSPSGISTTSSRYFVTVDVSTDLGFRVPMSPGDIDGDGVDDLVIGMPYGGALYFYRGGGWDWTAPTAVVRRPREALGTLVY